MERNIVIFGADSEITGISVRLVGNLRQQPKRKLDSSGKP